MKNKFKNIIIGILTTILMGYIIVTTLIYSTLNISKKYMDKDKIGNMINNTSLADNILNNDSLKSISNELVEAGLSNESVDKFIHSNDVKNFKEKTLTNLVYDIFDDGKIEYEINNDEVKNLLYNNIEELNDKDSTVAKKLDKKIPILVEKSNKILKKVSDKVQETEVFTKYGTLINKILKILDIIYSNAIIYTLLFMILTFILLMMFIRENLYKAFKWNGISFVIVSIILDILGKLLLRNKSSEFINMVASDLKHYSIIYLVIAITFIITNIAISIRNRKLKKLPQYP